ncbi:MAG: hypothetical protein HY811_08640 [Planctomycetes bacterium]|nr:hypothetical protein [Planctomycetota bacterium]
MRLPICPRLCNRSSCGLWKKSFSSRKEIPERSEVPTNVGADISPSALALFTAYPWPGNIRELENEIKRICALYPDAKTITEIMLSEIIRNYLSSTPSTTMGQDGLSLKEIERNAIITALQKYQGNITQTARQLGLTRFGLRKKLKHDSIKPADVTKR